MLFISNTLDIIRAQNTLAKSAQNLVTTLAQHIDYQLFNLKLLKNKTAQFGDTFLCLKHNSFSAYAKMQFTKTYHQFSTIILSHITPSYSSIRHYSFYKIALYNRINTVYKEKQPFTKYLTEYRKQNCIFIF